MSNENHVNSTVVATTTAAPPDIRDDDIIEINAGGTIIQTRRRTLTHVALDTVFASMFSGRWVLQHDDKGRIFLDEDPELIIFIVNYLRTKAIEGPATTSSTVDEIIIDCPKIPEGKERAFRVLLNYYGLMPFFYPSSIFIPLDIDTIEVIQPHGSDVTMTKSENKIQISKKNNTSEYFYFLACKQPLNSSGEGTFWKVTIDACPVNHGLLLGIIGTFDASNNSWNHPTCCGVYGNEVYINGNRENTWHDEGYTEGECLYFHLKSNKLTVFSVQKNEKVTMDVATTVDKYYIHFNIFYPGTKITLEPLNKDESTRLL